MKNWLFIFFTTITTSSFGQLFQEDFSGEADGAVSGTAVGGTWSVTTTPSGGAATFAKQTNIFGNGIFEANGTGTEGVWTSSTIDISGTGAAVISISLASILTDASDYVRCSYIVDGGAETQFAEQLGQTISVTTAGSAIVSGSTLQLIVRSMENPGGGGYMRFDDVIVTAVTRLYSKKSGNWDDVADGGDGFTWAINSHVGADYPFVPTANELIYIGAGHVVNLNVAGTAGGVVIEGTAGSELRYTAGVSLNLSGGILDVQSGSTGINQNGQGAASIIFSLAIPVTFNVNAPVSTGGLTFTAGSTANISGSNTLSVNGNISMNATGATINNSGTITATGNILADNGGLFVPSVTINNNGGANLSFSTINMTEASIGDADITINNSGTINQSGTFSNIDNGSTFNNLNGGTWNYSGTGHDTSVRLFASSVTNDFNYTLGGAQQIITPDATDGYYNINLQNSGAKTALGNFSVYGNWNRTGATFAPAGFTVTFKAQAGTAAQSITAAGGETFAGLTINSDFATSPQITLGNSVTVTGVLTMTKGNIDLNTNTLSLSSTAATALDQGGSSARGWMYGGFFARTFAATGGAGTIAIGSDAGLFPMGSATDWRPFFVGKAAIANSGGTITVSHTNGTGSTTVAFAEGIVRRHNSSWTVTKSAGLTAGTWDVRAGGTSFGTIEAGAAGLLDLRMCTTTGVVGTHGAATGGPDYRVNRTGVTIASPLVNTYHVASTDAVNSPLPIELVDFKANVINNEIELNWMTASELYNDFFMVERSSTGEVFSSIGQVNGNGTTSQVNTYTMIDSHPMNGRSYYRLKQTDFDGTFTYSNIISITYDGPTSAVMNVYPNPSNGTEITFELTGLGETEVIPVVVYDHLGKEYSKFELRSDFNNGYIKETRVFDNPIPKGVYILKAGPTPYLTKRLIVVN